MFFLSNVFYQIDWNTGWIFIFLFQVYWHFHVLVLERLVWKCSIMWDFRDDCFLDNFFRFLAINWGIFETGKGQYESEIHRQLITRKNFSSFPSFIYPLPKLFLCWCARRWRIQYFIFFSFCHSRRFEKIGILLWAVFWNVVLLENGGFFEPAWLRNEIKQSLICGNSAPKK